MSAEVWIGLATILGLILIAVIQTVAYGGVYGWLDVRSSQTADEVRKNIEEYGPEVPGLKLNLLPEEERRAVLEAREAQQAAHNAANH